MFRRSIITLRRAFSNASLKTSRTSCRNGFLTRSRYDSLQLFQVRFNSSIPQNVAEAKIDPPQLMIAFTCKVCDTRSSHTFSKQLYTKGSVLIQCPGCKNRHLIADNLNVFRDEKVNLEDLLKAKGESVAQSTDDLAFEDIPESLRKTLGPYAKDAPEESQTKELESPCLDSGVKAKHDK